MAEECGMRMSKIQHFSHTQHALRFNYGGRLYRCDGCQEIGFGFRYECRPCNFDLHESCARAPKSTSHSCHPQYPLVFKEKPVSPHVTCDVCGGKILGFVYECRQCNIDLHPSRAKLPATLRHALHPHHTLQLALSNSTAHVCNLCGEACAPGKRSYCCCEGSMPCDFSLHISCAKLPVDPLEEMRMQSISPGSTPCDFILDLHCPEVPVVPGSPGNVSTATVLPRGYLSATNGSRSTGAQVESYLKGVESVSKVMESVSNIADFVSALSLN